MPRGDACRLSLCVVHRRPGGLQDGPGCAAPAVGDPCRTRTRVRCVRGSRPTARRTGHGCRRAEGGGFEPRGLSTPTGFRNRAPATPAAPSQPMVSPVRFERTTPAFGGQRSVPLSYGEMAPEARFKLTTGASHAPVLFTTPPGYDTQCGALQATRTGLEPVAPGWTVRRSCIAVESSGGRGRSPAFWFRARCAAGYTTPEWCVPGGSNSDPRGKSPLGFQLPQGRGEAGDRPARASGGDGASATGSGRGGESASTGEVCGGDRSPARVRTERVELSWTRSAGF